MWHLSSRKSYGQHGFTTIELLVVVTLMIVVISAAAGIFLLVSRFQKRVIANQQVQADVRFAMETMVRDIHVGLIDYAYYGSSLSDNSGVVQAMSTLALLDAANQPVRYRFNSSANALEVSRGYVDNWQTLLANNVSVINVKFYIVPAADPFQACGAGGVDCSLVPNEQPRVTISLTAQNVPETGFPTVSLMLQTTVLARTYRR